MKKIDLSEYIKKLQNMSESEIDAAVDKFNIQRAKEIKSVVKPEIENFLNKENVEIIKKTAELLEQISQANETIKEIQQKIYAEGNYINDYDIKARAMTTLEKAKYSRAVASKENAYFELLVLEDEEAFKNLKSVGAELSRKIYLECRKTPETISEFVIKLHRLYELDFNEYQVENMVRDILREKVSEVVKDDKNIFTNSLFGDKTCKTFSERLLKEMQKNGI